MALKDFKTFQANANPHSTISALSVFPLRSDQDMIAVEIKKQYKYIIV